MTATEFRLRPHEFGRCNWRNLSLRATCGISLTVLWQKAHMKLMMVAKGFAGGSNMSSNHLLFSRLQTRCNFQQQHPDTATFVHTHLLEAV